MEKEKLIFWGLVGAGILLILIDLIRVYYCFQDDCCSMNYLLFHKEAICPTFGRPDMVWLH